MHLTAPKTGKGTRNSQLFCMYELDVKVKLKNDNLIVSASNKSRQSRINVTMTEARKNA